MIFSGQETVGAELACRLKHFFILADNVSHVKESIISRERRVSAVYSIADLCVKVFSFL